MDDTPFRLEIPEEHKQGLISALPAITAAREYVKVLKDVGIDVSEHEQRIDYLHRLNTRLVDVFVNGKRPRRPL